MCSPIRCRSCGKITWSGCGLHIEQALAGVPAERRCGCTEPPASDERVGVWGRFRAGR